MAQRYGQHALDATLEEVMPAIRPQPIDQPGEPADHLLKHSELMQSLQALFDAALSRAGAFNSDEDFPDYSALAEEADLTLAEYEAVAMHIDGWLTQDVAKFQGVGIESVRSARRRGLTKIRQYVLNSTSTVFGSLLLRGQLGDDEA